MNLKWRKKRGACAELDFLKAASKSSLGRFLYSHLIAVMGSTDEALRDGTTQASAATTMITKATPRISSGSCSAFLTYRMISWKPGDSGSRKFGIGRADLRIVMCMPPHERSR
jgi:hypothetical protein